MYFLAITIMAKKSVNRSEPPIYNICMSQLEIERCAQIEQTYENDEIFILSSFHFNIIWLLAIPESIGRAYGNTECPSTSSCFAYSNGTLLRTILCISGQDELIWLVKQRGEVTYEL